MYTQESACTELNRFCCNIVNSKPTLKKQYNYHYQIQGALYVIGRPWCDLFIWTPNGIFTERINYDATFWNIAYRKLQTFYYEFLLPELANPCYPKGQPLHHRQIHTSTVTAVAFLIMYIYDHHTAYLFSISVFYHGNSLWFAPFN